MLVLFAALCLAPSSYDVSPGERITLRVAGESHSPERFRDSALLTDTAAYNVTNLRVRDGEVVGDAVVKASGTIVVYTRSGSQAGKVLLHSLEPSDLYRRRVGLSLEIIPEKNPYTLGIGERLPLQIVRREKPSAGVEIEVRHGSESVAVGRTGEDGRISVALPEAGPYCIVAVAADASSTLSFEVRE